MGQGADGQDGGGGERRALIGLDQLRARGDQARGEEGHDPPAHAHQLEGVGGISGDEAQGGAVLKDWSEPLDSFLRG